MFLPVSLIRFADRTLNHAGSEGSNTRVGGSVEEGEGGERSAQVRQRSGGEGTRGRRAARMNARRQHPRYRSSSLPP